MPIARVFQCGNSQAVRLPKSIHVNSKELEIFRCGDEIVLRERGSYPKASLADAFDAIASMPLDALQDIKDTRPPQKRKGL